MRVGRCPQPPLLAAAPGAAPARLAVAQRRRVDLWQLGAALSRTEQVRGPGVPGFQLPRVLGQVARARHVRGAHAPLHNTTSMLTRQSGCTVRLRRAAPCLGAAAWA